ncbi:MAG: flagellar export chaperone FlgN [Acidimicrobiales bacterium]
MTVLPAAASSATSLEDLLGELSRTLWNQRALIEVLQYRLEVQQLICINDRAHRLQMAVDEVEAALDDIRRSERARDQIVARCASTLGADAGISLVELCGRVPEPWDAVLAEHQAALLALVNGTERLAATNRELVVRGANDTRALLDAVAGNRPDTSYRATGSAGARGLTPPTMLDRRA